MTQVSIEAHDRIVQALMTQVSIEAHDRIVRVLMALIIEDTETIKELRGTADHSCEIVSRQIAWLLEFSERHPRVDRAVIYEAFLVDPLDR